MTHHETPKKEANAENDDPVCPHCGSVLDVARAVENDRSVLRPRAKAAAPLASASPPDDPSFS